MSIEIKNNEIEKEDKNHRRRGGAFDTLSKFLRSIEKAVFKLGSVIQDRPGDSSIDGIDAPSVFEIYQQNRTEKDKFNLFYIGRKGTGESKNTNYLELIADSKTDSKRSSGNGQIRINVSRDGQNLSTAFSLIDLSTAVGGEGLEGPRFQIVTRESDGANVGFEIGHFGTNGALKFALAIDSDGIQMFGLPTSDPGKAGALFTGTVSGTPRVVRVSAG